MLLVGAKSTQFILKEVQVEANYTGDKSKFYAGAGELIHLSIAEEIRTWTLSENTQDSLVDGTAYYIYAKCTKEAVYTGQIIVDKAQRKFDDDPTYYYFLIGVLQSVVDGIRGISLTYGQTIINGKFVTTGSITADKLNIANVADIGNIILGNTGFIRTTGKDSYDSEVTGFWLGYSDGYKFNIGNATHYLKWTVSVSDIKGKITISGRGSNDEIYFKDSGIWFYDAVSANDKQIFWKYGDIDFARLTYKTDAIIESTLHVYAGDYALFMGQKANGVAGFITTGSQIVIGTGESLSSLMFWTGTHQLYLGVSVNAPTENNYAGQIIIKEGGESNALHLYTTAWRSIASSLGW